MIDLAPIAAAVQDSSFGAWAAGSALAYPVANVLHLLGLVMLVGGIGIVDLRLAGLFRSLPLVPLSRALTPIALAGLAVLVASGATMFAADAASFAASPVFQLKLVLIALALANAVAFRALWHSRMNSWTGAPPLAVRIMAVGSIGLWLGAATLGRLIAYS